MTKFNFSNILYDTGKNQFELIRTGPIMVQARKITYCSRNQPPYYDPSYNNKKYGKWH
jgi:hypothetical protein